MKKRSNGVTVSRFRYWMAGRRRTRTVETVLAHSPLQASARVIARRRLCVLAYHGVSDAKKFTAQLDWLSANTTPVALDDVRLSLLEGGDFPQHPVLLTFDDGDPSVLDVAAPLLRERGIPAVAFVVAGLIDTETPFWWTEVEELMRSGARAEVSGPELLHRLKIASDDERRRLIESLRAQVAHPVRTPQLTRDDLRKLELDGVSVGNHSLTHPCLDKCDDQTLRREVHESHARLTEILGHPPDSFAYPNGNWDERVREQVRAAGYSMAFGFDHRVVSRTADPLTISRVRVDAAADLDRFRILASGLHSGLHRLRGRS